MKYYYELRNEFDLYEFIAQDDDEAVEILSEEFLTGRIEYLENELGNVIYDKEVNCQLPKWL